MQTEFSYKKTQFTYDHWGNILTKTDKTHPNHPLTTTYTYDGWNRIKSETTYTGQLTTYIKGWNNDGTSFTVTQGTGKPWQRVCYDITGNKISVESVSVLNLPISEFFFYGCRGELLSYIKTYGYFLNAINLYENNTYDKRGRVLSTVRSGQPDIYYSYGPNSVISTENERIVEKHFDLWGNVTQIIDNTGTMSYQYGSHGHPQSISYGGKTISMTYDVLGRKKSLNDPDAGQMTYTYDDLDRVKSECDAKNNLTQNTYSSEGLLKASTTNGILTTHIYGQLSENRYQLLSSTRGNCSIKYTYDDLGRIATERRVIGTTDSVEVHFTYNSIGQLSEKEYLNGPTVNYTYDAYGYKDEVEADGILISKPLEHLSYVISKMRGENLTSETILDDNRKVLYMDLVCENNPNLYHDLWYYYDEDSGNIDRREGMFPWDEEFYYDDLDRLTGIYSDREYMIEYAPNGNITYQTGIGHYYYNGNKPHAVTLVENTENRIPHSTLQTTFNSFGKIMSISCENGKSEEMTFTYGPDNERWQTILKKNHTLSRKVSYLGDCEKIIANGRIRRLYYLDDGAIFVKQANRPDSIYFTFTDHLGSIVAIVDYNGIEKFKAAYDAWGNQTIYRNDIDFHRGYTGHEMLPDFDLINMNGRLYDPILGRFLSTDNFVQAPWDSQNFNRYTYCLNNPLKYTDPSGNSFVLTAIIGAVIGTYMGGSIANGTYNPTKWDFSAAETWGSMFCGGMVGAVSGYIGAAVSSSGFIGSNTLGIMAASTINSLGTNAYTLGGTPITISAGAVSYDFTNHEFGYLWKKGNSKLENWGYGLGALANLHDINNLIDATNTKLYTQTTAEGQFDPISHSALVSTKEKNILMSYGPDDANVPNSKIGFAFNLRKSSSMYDPHIEEGIVSDEMLLNSKLFSAIRSFSQHFPYQGVTSNCVNWASIGLWLNGIPNIGLHPFLLHGSIAVYNSGVYNALASYPFMK